MIDEGLHHMILSIQILRALSAIVILIYHIAVNQIGETVAVQSLRIGVDVFFVISGYIIARSTEEPINPGHFLARRFLRIYPVWWAALAMWMLVTRLAFGETNPISDIVTSFALIISWNERYQNFVPIYHIGWSLCYEVLFYAIWALSITVASRVRLRHLVVAIGLICGLIVCARITLKIAPGIHGLLPYGSPLFLEFLAGAVIRQAERNGFLTLAGRAAGRLRSWICIGTSAIGFGLIASGILPIAMSGAVATLIVLTFLSIRARGASVVGNMGLYLGNASYSIYVFHAIVLDVAFARTGVLTRNEPDPIKAVIAFAACLAFSLAMYHLIEKPCILLGKHLTSDWRHPLKAAQP